MSTFIPLSEQDLLDKKRCGRLLCLDGGGMKGLCELSLVEALEKATNKRACELFDWIYGTSTGGIIALGLANGCSAAEVRKFYLDFGPKIFGEKSQGLFRSVSGASDGVSLASRFSATGRSYDIEVLRKVVSDHFGDKKIASIAYPRVGVVASRVPNPAPYVLRSFVSIGDVPGTNESTITEAALATSAHPIAFHPVVVGGITLQDGGCSGHNNPTLKAVDDWTAHYYNTAARLSVIVSMGNGSTVDVTVPEETPPSLREQLTHLAKYFVSSSEVDKSMRRRLSVWPTKEERPHYYRFSPQIAKLPSFTETDEVILSQFAAEVSSYIALPKSQEYLKELATKLLDFSN